VKIPELTVRSGKVLEPVRTYETTKPVRKDKEIEKKPLAKVMDIRQPVWKILKKQVRSQGSTVRSDRFARIGRKTPEAGQKILPVFSDRKWL
jgi:hypothetical protein